MAEWQIWLFGAPRLVHKEQEAAIQRRKHWALLAYLLLTPRTYPREMLAAYLWPTYSQPQALANLRRELSRLHHLTGNLLSYDRSTVAIFPSEALWVDVLTFDHHYAALHRHSHQPGKLCPECYEHLVAAHALYTGDFLAGISLSDCPEFEEWQFFQQEALRNRFFEILNRLSEHFIALHDYPQAITVSQELLTVDPLYEDGQRRLIWLYAQTGQRSAALRQFHSFAKRMDAELHAAPDDETTTLIAQIATDHGKSGEPAKAPGSAHHAAHAEWSDDMAIADAS